MEIHIRLIYWEHFTVSVREVFNLFVKNYVLSTVILAIILSSGTLGFIVLNASAKSNFTVGLVTFTMDDGHKGQYLNAFPILSSRDIPATVYIIADRIESPYYVNVSELHEMVAAGWEVGGHGEYPLTEMSDDELEAEVRNSKQVLESHGFTPTSFAYPWGRYDNRVVSVVKQYYETAVGVSSTGLPYTANELGSENDKPWTQFGRYHIYGDTDEVLQYIDQAVAEKSWMIFFFHDCYEDGTVDGGSSLIQIADYVKERVNLGVLKVVTFSQGWNIWKGVEPPPPPPEGGTLSCDAIYNGSPVNAGCKVYYDDILVASATTPFSIKLDPGGYTIKATYLGLETEENALIESDKTTYVTLEFTGELPPALVQNPNFEDWTNGKPDYWKIQWNRKTIKITQSTDVYEGNFAAEVFSDRKYNGIYQERLLSELNLEIGDKVTISGWLKNVEGVEKARVALRFYDESGNRIGYGAYKTVSLTTDTWIQSEATIVIPENTYSIQIQINPTSWVSGYDSGTFIVDAISLTKIT